MTMALQWNPAVALYRVLVMGPNSALLPGVLSLSIWLGKTRLLFVSLLGTVAQPALGFPVMMSPGPGSNLLSLPDRFEVVTLPSVSLTSLV